jgi:hypothetical protein
MGRQRVAREAQEVADGGQIPGTAPAVGETRSRAEETVVPGGRKGMN